MEEWAKDQEAENVTLLPDGNGEFTEAMGLLVDKSELDFGKRSWRYSMLVRDGVDREDVHRAEKPGDPFEVSDADTMLSYLDPKAKKPDQMAILTREGCSFCAKAKKMLNEAGRDTPRSRSAHDPQQGARRDHRGADRAAGVRRRPADRRLGSAREVPCRRTPQQPRERGLRRRRRAFPVKRHEPFARRTKGELHAEAITPRSRGTALDSSQ